MADPFADRVVLITGASRGLGRQLALALAARRARLALVARDGTALDDVAAAVRAAGGAAECFAVDLLDRASLDGLLADVEARLGPVDVLVHNAGLEAFAYYDQTDPADIDRVIDLNLRAPMQLTRAALPGLLERDRGHVVLMASLAGLGPAAFGESYGATKAALVGFGRSLRASLKARGSAVSCSVIAPGYVRDVGMYADMQADGAEAAPFWLGTSSPAAVVAAVLRAVERDLPDVVVNPGPTRWIFALQALFPRLVETLSRWLGSHRVFETAARARGRRSA